MHGRGASVGRAPSRALPQLLPTQPSPWGAGSPHWGQGALHCSPSWGERLWCTAPHPLGPSTHRAAALVTASLSLAAPPLHLQGLRGTPGPVWVLPGGVGTPWWPGRTGQGTAGTEGMGDCPGQCGVLQERWWCHGDAALSHSRDRAAPCPGYSLQCGVTNSWHPPRLEMSFNRVQPPIRLTTARH